MTFHRTRTRTGTAPVTAPSAGVTQVTPQPGFTQPSRWPRTGRLETVRIRGDISQLSNPAYAYLPPQYFQAHYRHTAFPGVEILSGYPSTDKMLVQRLAPQHTLRIELAHRRAKPMVLVMTRPTLTYPRDTECTDVPGGPQAETYHAQDVPRTIVSNYRVAPTGGGFAGVCPRGQRLESPGSPAAISAPAIRSWPWPFGWSPSETSSRVMSVPLRWNGVKRSTYVAPSAAAADLRAVFVRRVNEIDAATPASGNDSRATSPSSKTFQ